MPTEEQENYVRVLVDDATDHNSAEHAWGTDHGPVPGGRRFELRSSLAFSQDPTIENCPKVGDYILVEDKGYLCFDVRTGTVLERANEL
jgi:hypothetical protein